VAKAKYIASWLAYRRGCGGWWQRRLAALVGVSNGIISVISKSAIMAWRPISVGGVARRKRNGIESGVS